jgi:hypothetical protein
VSANGSFFKYVFFISALFLIVRCAICDNKIVPLFSSLKYFNLFSVE